jgi:hypothetical protein
MKWIQTNKNPDENPNLSMNLDEKHPTHHAKYLRLLTAFVNSKINLGFW